MSSLDPDLAFLESAALQAESLEHIAEKSFDSVPRSGSVADIAASPECQRWLAARADTDAAWGRWAERMHATEESGGANG